MTCTTSDCEREATRVVAWPSLNGRALFVGPYCEEHGADLECDRGGLPAAGPALAAEVQAMAEENAEPLAYSSDLRQEEL